ncbi:cation channel sperm-associated auxiliary subunit beta [Apodemus sylvaticus]|uniref:cation channel sperm-associated auxiliary subunit beta n=1 Tax=Apodemus sylvaticus TaxID=10129 RepID=UPI0022435533|nr:cation channel sperm-associated auxiliary subunit beta [Apodemus sylvaticus]
MESSLIYVMLLLLNIFEFSSGIIHNTGKERAYFSCSGDGILTGLHTIKLFLTTDNLKVYCFFRNENESPSREILGLFTSGGLAPNMIIMNSTYYGGYNFKLSPFSNRLEWIIDIPRENITVNTDIAAVEQWLIKITMHEGLNIYDTEGTLLDLVREPILQWNLGRILTEMEVKNLQLDVEDIKVAKSPCANDVALIGLSMKPSSNGVFIGKTISGFWTYEECIWYDLTEIIYAELNDEHQGLTVIDLVLTNHFLVILTSLGLYVSSDLRYPTTSQIKLSRAEFCGFERVDYIKGNLWYNEKCFANRETFEVDYVTITFNRNRTLSESSSCFFSKEPFIQWLPCLYSTYKNERSIPHVITFLIDQETDSGIYLLHMKDTKQTFVSVSMLKDGKPSPRPKFPSFQFPSTFILPLGMVFHPRSHFLYIYGNQIWVSMDGGNTFEMICNLFSHHARKSSHSFYTSDIVFMVEDGRILMTKAGLLNYGELGVFKDKVYTLYYDHLGYIHKLTPQTFDAGSELLGHGSSSSIFGRRPDLGFETALVPQFISSQEMYLFAYVPLSFPVKIRWQKRFKRVHLKKTIELSTTGVSYIRNVYMHTTKPTGFESSIHAEIIEPFGIEDSKESPCLLSDLEIKYSGNISYTLNLQSNDPQILFKPTDLEKSVVIPGHSSFLIIEIKGQRTASALATMPQSINSTLKFTTGSWFLYNFGTVGGRRAWTISLRPCNYWIHSDALDFMSLNLVKYIDVGNKVDFQFKIIPKAMTTFPIPPVTILVGNPALVEVKAEGVFDLTQNYHLNIHVAGKFFQKGSTSLALTTWESALSCFAVTLLPTIKSSCSYLRTMHHSPGRHVPIEDWISGVHMDSQGFNMIKTLPINYRPPSNMGISIPLTDNFYHADPSKPIPRNQFHKSKETGKYKQCANVTSRAMCNCSEHQKFSHAVAYSDCKEKVHRFKFPVTQYPVVLEIFNERDKVSAEPPYLVTMTEVNMRKNWQLIHHEPENVKKMKNYLEPLLKTPVYNPLGLNLTIKGSELFHFKVSVVPGVSFCDLNEEFQIYVDEVPLPFPGHALIAVATSVVLGGLIFVAFVFQLRNIHPLRTLKGFMKGNPALTSTTTVNS